LDVYGSKGQVHVANTFLIMTYKGTDDTQTDREDYLRDVYMLCDIKKNRDGPPFYFMAKHSVMDGLFSEISDPKRKPTKEANDAAEAVVKEAESLGKGEATPKASGGIQTVPVAIQTASNLNTGLRDAQMEYVDALEGAEDTEEVATVTGQDEQAIALALSEAAAAEVIPEQTDVFKTVPKSLLDRIRASKISIPGV
jgi:hypothetical protein